MNDIKTSQPELHTPPDTQPGAQLSADNDADTKASKAKTPDSLSHLLMHYDRDSNALKVTLTAFDTPPLINRIELKQKLAERGYDNWHFDDASFKELLTALNHGHTYQGIIGKQVDADIEIEISSDKKCAWATLTPAQGGENLNPPKLQGILEGMNIYQACLQQDNINKLLKNQSTQRICIAAAIEPGKGTPSKIKQLIKKEEKKPQENEDGRVDHKNIHDFIIIDEGEPLLQRIPAVQGKPGRDVTGGEIAPKLLKDLSFPKKLEGVVADFSDENILVAEISGHPVYSRDSLKVDSVLQLAAVNIESGNINFSGSISINGDVESDFTVKAAGDIFIKGSLIRATVISGGSITVAEGIIGAELGSELHDNSGDKNGGENKDNNHTDEVHHFAAKVTATHQVTAKFITLAQVHCGGDMHVREYILNSDILSKSVVFVGQEGGKGCIMGGQTHGDKGITAKILGNDAYISTPVSAGRSPQAKKQQKKINDEFQQLFEEKKNLVQYLKEHSGELKQKSSTNNKQDTSEDIKDKIQLLQKNMDHLKNKSERIESMIDIMNKAKITATQTLYPNVKISINGHDIISKNTRKRSVLIQSDKGISLFDE